MSSRLPSVLLVLLACALLAPAAHASHAQTMTFEAPRDLLDAGLREGALNEIGGLGVSSLRVILYWHDVAPSPDADRKPAFDASDPAAYDWSRYDPLLDAARQRGWKVLLTVSGPVPRWATLARRDTLTRPSPKEFALFTEAVARHYAERVASYSIWNEPNQPQFLLPQYFKGQAASPLWYRRLFFAGVHGLEKGGIANPTVLMGETSPRGNSHVVAPLRFMRGVLCLDSRYRRDRSCARLPADGYAHHAYTTAGGPFFHPPNGDDVTIGVLSRLVTALDRAGRTGAIATHMPVSLTEFGIQSVPDPIYGVSQARQAEYQAISERLAWDQPRVRAFSQYLLRDDQPKQGVSKTERYGGFESGLRFSDGRAKVSLTSFPVPLAALRSGSRVTLWGRARPAAGATTVTVLYGNSRFRPYHHYRTDRYGVFAQRVPYVRGRRYRLRWTAPDGHVLTGPPIRVYRRP